MFFAWCGVLCLAMGLLLALSLAFPRMASAQKAPDGNLFNCKVFYTSDTIGDPIYSIDPTQTPVTATNVVWGPTQGSATSNPVRIVGTAAGDPTLALGPALDANGEIIYKSDGDPQLRMYHWGWDWTSAGGADGSRRIKYLDDAPGAKWQFLPVASLATAENTTYWAGGEVNQITGEIYLAGGLVGTAGAPSCPSGTSTATGISARLGCRLRLGILNPATGAFRHSGMMQPASPSDAVVGDYQVVSDMAIDAEGNAYFVAGTSTNTSNLILIRVIPQDTTGGWKYNVISKMTRPSAASMPNHYGMSFLNGKLYIGYLATNIIECDPLGGGCRMLGNPAPGYYRDLAGCQVAPVITGTIYKDPEGEGNVNPATAVGVEGVKVSIYKNENGAIVYKGFQTTDGLGSYSFIVDSINATFYIRIEQPQIDGINAQPTWATVGGDKNKVSTFCLDEDNPTSPPLERLPLTTDLKGDRCVGTKLFGADPAGPADSGTPWDITKAQMYSKVVMTTDREVVHADFAISAKASFGDAQVSSGVTNDFKVRQADGGPAHNLVFKRLWLGDTVSVWPDGVADPNSNAHPSDDGVFITLAGVDVPLQNAVLTRGRNDYQLKVKVNGQHSQSGYLSAWDNLSGAVTKKVSDLQDAANSGQIVIPNYMTESGTGAPVARAVRFRFSSTPGLPAQSSSAAPGGGQLAPGSTVANKPWVVDGEVEDYRVYLATSIVRMATISLNGVGTFNYSFNSEIWNTAPSSNTASVTTRLPGMQANEAPGVLHSTTNYTSPASVTVTQNKLPDRWVLVSAVCKDSSSGNLIPTTGSGETLTIPASSLSMGADITCLYTNRYIVADPEQSTLTVTPSGPILTTSSYTATVTAKDGTGVPQEGVDIVLSVTGGALAGTTTGTFAADTCTTNASGVCSVTWTSAVAGTFAISARIDGENVGNCLLNAGACSPQSRQFVIPFDPAQSELTTSKTTVTANNTETARLTVTLKDASGNATTSVGTTTVNFGGSSPGTFSAGSCDIPQGGSSCYVDIKSATTGTANVTAQIGGVAVKYSPLAVTFTYGPIDLANSTLTAEPSTLVANGVSQSTVTMTLKDATGNLVLDPTVVTFTALAASDGKLSSLTCTTSATTGACSVTYTSPFLLPTAQQATVTASVAGVSGTKTATIFLTDDENREITVTKIVSGSGVAAGGYISGGKFDITVQCGAAAATTLQLANGESDAIIAKVGDVCAVSEAPPSTTTVRSGFTNKATYPSVIVVGVESTRAITVTNTITSGATPTFALLVQKTVTGLTSYHDPATIFAINVSCAGDPDTKIVRLKDRESGYVDVAANAKCTISEPSPPPSTNPANAWYVPMIAPSTINAVSSHRDVKVMNVLTDQPLTKVEVVNTVSGDIAASNYQTGGQFTVTLNCGASNFSDAMTESDTYTYFVSPNASCALSTDSSPMRLPMLNSGYTWYAHTSVPALPFNVSGDMSATVDHNIQRSGSVNLIVRKRVTATAGGYSNGKFAITVNCGGGNVKTMSLAHNESDTIVAQVGNVCTVSEAVPPGVVASGFTNEATYPSKIVVGAENPRTLYVDNVVSSGTTPVQTLTVSKTVSDAAANHDPNAKFEINLVCNPDPNSVKTVTLMRDEEARIEVARDAACTISETLPVSALNGYWYTPNITPSGIAKVSADQDVTVNNVVTNQTLYKVDVKNTVTGETAASGYAASSAFLVTLNCGATIFTNAMTEGNTYSYWAPTNASCSLTTTTWPTLNNGFSWVDTVTPTSPFNVTMDMSATVNHEIKRNTDAAYSTLTIDKLGPVGITSYPTDNAYTVTVRASDATNAAQPNVPIVITVSGGALAATSTGSFATATGVCITDVSGTCVVTWTSANAGTFTVNATLEGVNIGNCTANAATCSPQSRTFYGSADCTSSTLTANPTALDANGTATSTVTATLKDANGTPVLSPTSINFSLPNASYGSLSALSCTTSATTGACSVTYTSPSAVPVGGKATINAALPCGNRSADITLGNSPNQTITVKKTVSGSGYTGAPFAVTVNCTGVSNVSKTLSLVHGGQDTVVVPNHSKCIVSEANPDATVIGANSTNTAIIAPASFTVNSADETVNITNRISSGTFEKGTLSVAKVISGSGPDIAAGHVASNEFNIRVSCAGAPEANFALRGGQTATVEGALGQACAITEPDILSAPSANAGYRYVQSITPASMPFLPSARDVTVDNKVVKNDGTPYHTVTLTNAVSGDQTPSVYNPTGTFTLALNCDTFSQTPAMYVGEVASYSVAGLTETGTIANCEVNTLASPPILNSEYLWYEHRYNPASPFAVVGNVNEVVTHVLDRVTTRTITVTKTVSGPAKAAGYVTGGKFAINVQCGAGAAIPLQLADGESNSSLKAQVGDVCTIVEAEPTTMVVRSGYTNTALISPSRFTVGNDTTVNVINRIENGTLVKKTLTVTKTVTGELSGHVAGNIFGINVNCANTTAASFQLQKDWSATVEAEAGQACEITEPSLPNAGAGYKYVANITPTITTLPTATSLLTGINVTVENRVVPSSMTFYPVLLNNAVTGDPTPSAYNRDDSFVLAMDCQAGYLWSAITMMPGDVVMRQIPAGSSCTMDTLHRPAITNTAYKWDNTTGTVYNPTSPFPVNAAVNETATHRIIPAIMRDITVRKSVTGGSSGSAFTVRVDCGGGNSKVMTLADGGSGVIQALDGSVCTVSEDATTNVGGGNGYTAMIVPSRFTVEANQEVLVTNRIETGKPNIDKAIVTVSKQVNGALGGHNAANTFEIFVACDDTTTAVFRLKDGWSASVEGEVGARCTITEPTLPSANAGYVYAKSLSPTVSELPMAGLNVAVTNTVVSSSTTMRTVTLTNAVSGDQTPSVYNHAQPFVLTLNCGAGYNFGEVAMLAEAVSSYSVPNNATCVVNTVEAKLPSTNAAYEWYSHTYSPATSFNVTADRAAIVTHGLRPVGFYTVTVRKTVIGTANGEFSVQVDCGGSYKKAMSLADGGAGSLLAPNGSTCVVSEDDPGASVIGAGNNNTAIIAPSSFTVNGKDVEIGIINRISAGTIAKGKLTVTKAITGNTAAHIASNIFGIRVACDTTPVADFKLMENQSATVEGELGQACTITEPTIPAASGAYHYVPNISPKKTALKSEQAVTVENMVVSGPHHEVTLTNIVDGDITPSAYDNDGNFTLALACGASPYRWTRDMHTGDEAGFWVPNASSCEISTTARPTITNLGYKWYGENYSPATPFVVTTDVREIATHYLRPATTRTITISKSVSGAGYMSGGKFNVTVTCGSAITPLQLADGESATLEAADGTACSVTEANPGASVIGTGNTNTAIIAPSKFTVNGADEIVRITNRISSGDFAKGVLTVSKSVAGDANDVANGHDPSAVFNIVVTCGAVTPSANFALKNHQEAMVEGALGQLCTTTEPMLPPALSDYKYAPNISPSTTTLVATGVAVTVENFVLPNSVTVYPVTLTNAVTGDETPSLYNNSGTFALELNCGTFRRAPTMRLGDVSTYQVVSGSDCSVSTTARPAIFEPAIYKWGDTTYNPTSPFTVNRAVNEVATHALERTSVRAVKVSKTVIDGSGAYNHGAFHITLNCGSGYTKAMSLVGNGTDSLLVPLGSTCTVSEAEPDESVIGSVGNIGNNNTAVISPSRFVVTDDTDVAVTNRIGVGARTTATLEVSKSVTGSNKSVGHRPGNVFGIHVACDGLPEVNLALQDGWSATVQGTQGQRCAITEPSIPSANTGYRYVANNTGTVTLQADSGGAPGTQVVIENRVVPTGMTFYPVTLSNAVNGDPTPSAYNAAQPFVLTMECGDGTSAGTDDAWSIAAFVGDARIYNVPSGSLCTMGTTSRPPITNTTYKWDNTTGTVYAPTSPFTVNAAMTETATHRIIPSVMRDITVKKSVTGGSAAGAFNIQVTCGGSTTNLSLADGGSSVIQALDGTVCAVSEDAATNVGGGNGYTAMIVPSNFTVADDMTVNVTNRIETGKPSLDKALVKVSKQVNGAVSQHNAANRFNIEVACAGTTLAAFELRDGQSATVEAEVGQSCTISEPTLPNANAGYAYAPSISPSTSLLLATGLNVTVTNTVVSSSTTMRTVTLTNAVSGDQTPSVYNHAQPFVLTLNCGAGYNFGEVAMLAEAVSSYSVPDGRSCNVGIVGKPAMTNTDYKWYGETYSPAIPFTVNRNIAETVTHALVPVQTRTITVSKTVEDATGAYAGGAFNVNVRCGSEVTTLRLAHGDKGVVWAADGTLCSITEDEPDVGLIGAGNNNTAIIAPSSFTVNGKDVEIGIINRISAGTIAKGKLTVTKTIAGNTAAHIASNVFGIRVACDTTPVADFKLMENQSATVEGELGQACTITEPTIPAASGSYHYVPNISPKKTALKSEQQVTVENMVVSGLHHEVTLTNIVDGDITPSAYDNDGNFTLALACGASPYRWTRDMHTGDEAGFWVPNASSCEISTTDRPTITNLGYKWYGENYNPATPFAVNADVRETATHYLRPATTRTITVTLIVTGGTTASAFNVHVACDGMSTALLLANGQSGTVQAPDGAVCAVIEDNHPSAAGSGNSYTALIYPAEFTVNGDQNVTVENRIETGKADVEKSMLKVTKLVTGLTDDIKAAGHIPGTLFDINVDCPTTTLAQFTLKEGQSATVEAELWERCRIDEPDPLPPANTGYKYAENISPSTVQLIETNHGVSIVNVVVPDSITLHKVFLINEVSGAAPSEFDPHGYFGVSMDCGPGYELESWMQVGDESSYNIPDGTHCTMDRLAAPTPSNGFFWSGVTYSRGRTLVTIDEDETQIVTHDLEREGSVPVVIHKTLTGETARYLSGTFDVNVTCESVNETVHFAPAGSQVVWVPTGETCTISENTANAVLNNATSRRTITPYRFIAHGRGLTVSVENELLAGQVLLAPLTVSKTVTGDYKTVGHDPTMPFHISVETALKHKTLTLHDNQSGMTDVMVGDTVEIDETPLNANFGYMYAPTVNPSKIVNFSAAGRHSEVVNEVVVLGSTYSITFGQAAVMDVAGSGYTPGSIFNTNVTCGGKVYYLPLAEGEETKAAMKAGAVCATATAGALPTLNSGYDFSGPTTMPAFPYTVNQNGSITIAYAPVKREAPATNEPIPMLDPKALLLLIGLLLGAALWRGRGRAC